MQTINEHTRSTEILKMRNNVSNMSAFLFGHNLLENLKNIS